MATNEETAPVETPVDPAIPSEEERAQAAAEWQQLANMLKSFPKIPSYSTAKRVLVGFIGPQGRIWRVNNQIQVGVETLIEVKTPDGETVKQKQRSILGEAATYEDALKMLCFTLAKYQASIVTKGMPRDGEGQSAEVGAAAPADGAGAEGQSTDGAGLRSNAGASPVHADTQAAT